MDTSDIGDIEKTITEAIAGDENALNRLVFSVWLFQVLEKITARLARKFSLDANEIRDGICAKLRRKIRTIKNPHNRPLTKCVAGWCKSTGRRICLNKKRHFKVENAYSDRIIHENTHGKRKSPKGIDIPLQVAEANSPEEVAVNKEIATMWDERMNDLHRKVYEIIATLPPRDIEIAFLWFDGKTLKEIHQTTGIPISTAGRHLKNFQKHILETVGIQQIISASEDQDKKDNQGKKSERTLELERGAEELISNCLQEMNRFGYISATAV